MKTLAEQIQSFEATRQAKAARMTEIMNKSAEDGRTLDETESQEYDGLQSEIKGIDEHLVRLHEQEKLAVEKATPVTGVTDADSGTRVRGGVITVRGPELPKGAAFVRFVIALAAARGNRQDALEYVKAQAAWKDQTPMVQKMFENAAAFRLVKAPVAAGSTTATGWAAELVDYTNMASEFIEFLRPQTIIGKLTGIRRVPFNIQMPSQTAGSSSAWVGQGARKPISKLTFTQKTLGFAKSASIVVLNDELVRFSNPSAEAIVRQDLSEAMVQFLDEQFIDPSVTVVANVNPASVTNGAGHDAASGTDAAALRADFKDAVSAMLTANIAPNGSYWVMEPALALAIGLIQNALGAPEFPGISADGGTLLGYPVVTSNSCASGVATFMKPSEILLADDGGVSIDISKEASLVMDDGNSPAETTMVSMFQNNMVAIRAERYINWARRRDAAVYYLTSCNYGGAS
jgi:HK97 family phage major capsid protein